MRKQARLATYCCIRLCSYPKEKVGNVTFHSFFYMFKKDKAESYVFEFSKLLREGVKYIYKNNFVDDLKFPSGAPKPTSALLAKASFNIYYGDDIPGTEQMVDGVNTVERFAYATGTGSATIGIDPTTFRLYPLPPFFYKLKNKVHSLKTLSSMYKADFNAMSVKVYYRIPRTAIRKTTNWHSDVLYNKSNNAPLSNLNSQTPGTPVLLFSYGAEKKLLFRRSDCKNVQISFTQSANGFFVLDGRDEMWKEDKSTKKKWKWLHKSEHPYGKDNADTVVFVFMLRCVQKKVVVEKRTNKVRNNAGNNSFKEAQFDAEREIYKNADGYQDKVDVIEQRVKMLADCPLYL